MNQAMTYLYQIYSAFLDLVFNQFEITTNVTIGWIAIVIVVMTMLIVSILNVPKLAQRRKNG